jgi:DNA-binding response OmpR family regulator
MAIPPRALAGLNESLVFCNNATKSIPVVLLTAAGQASEIEQGLQCGADEYIVKPFDPEELLAKVKGWVTREE